ncbi:MAG: hypothetical protein ACRDRF_23705, partial [Pseudonocardiaceae bacterium]
ADTVVLGVDEHTAALFDLDADTVTVLGRATLTVRRRAVSTVFMSGVTVAIDELREIATGSGSTRRSANTQPATVEATSPTAFAARGGRATRVCIRHRATGP